MYKCLSEVWNASGWREENEYKNGKNEEGKKVPEVARGASRRAAII